MTINDKATMVDMYSNGATVRECAEEFDISYGNAHGVLKSAGVLRTKLPAINDATEHNGPKVLFVDIENAPTVAYTWGFWGVNIGENQVVSDGYMMTFAAKWAHEDDIIYDEQRGTNDVELVAHLIDLFDQADYVIAHNAPFDIKKTSAYALVNGIKPPSPYRYIDTLNIARKNFMLQRNTLSYLTSVLTKKSKLKHEQFHGMELWTECMAGNEDAWDEMKKYNIMDVWTLEELYHVLAPWHRQHPILFPSTSGEQVCPRCGGTHMHEDGIYVSPSTKSEAIRYVCDDCGGWSRGNYKMKPKEDRQSVLVSV